MAGRWSRLGRIGTGVAAALLLVGVSPQPGWGAPVAGTLVGDPAGKVVVGEQVRLKGSLPPAKARQVVLQTQVGSGDWSRVAVKRSFATGKFAFGVIVSATVGSVVRYRVLAPAATLAGKRYPARQTPSVTYRTVEPIALFSAPGLVMEGGPYVVSARFKPARPGRPVVLERLVGAGWVELGHAVQDVTGRASFGLSAGPEGVETWRAWAQTWRGAGQVGTEPTSTRVTARLTTGFHHTCLVKPDGSAWCWGWNLLGQLGDGSSVDRKVPVRVGTATDWVSVAGGAHHTCGLRSDRSLWCWGSNYYGQLGDGSNQSSSTPVQVPGSWLGVDVGAYHSCAVSEDGTAWCWGQNDYGQLGDSTTSARNAPVAVDFAGDWAEISAGYAHTCGLRSDGTAWCWGANESGQLGDGTTTQRLVPAQVGTATDWSTVTAAGGAQACGVRMTGAAPMGTVRTGTAWCWGANSLGLLGNGTTLGSLTPVQAGDAEDWIGLDVGGYQACGVRDTGIAWCWGMNQYGQLGDGTTTSSPSPVAVTGSGWGARIASGAGHVCALGSAASVWCWGHNDFGQLGDGSVENRSVPTPVAFP